MAEHHRIFGVNGLNVDPRGFSWQDRIMFTDSGLPDKHTATAYVRMKRSLADPIYESDINQHDKDIGEAWRLVSIFFACYGLVNKQDMPKIDNTQVAAFDIVQGRTSLGTLPYSIRIDAPSTFGTMSTEQTMGCLNKTLPFFEKVMNIIEKQKKKDKLHVSLLMYYHARQSIESIEELVDRITGLEALFSDGKSELSYKIALRTAILIENDNSKRREIFKFLKDAYEARSALVHGEDMTLQLMGEYRFYAKGLRFVHHNALLRYIELASKNKHKKDICDFIDDIALGSLSKARSRHDPTFDGDYYDPLF